MPDAGCMLWCVVLDNRTTSVGLTEMHECTNVARSLARSAVAMIHTRQGMGVLYVV